MKRLKKVMDEEAQEKLHQDPQGIDGASADLPPEMNILLWSADLNGSFPSPLAYVSDDEYPLTSTRLNH